MPLFARNTDTADLLENFIIVAVSSIIAVRMFLRYAGYPRIAYGDIHIAHLMWGGLFMLAGFILSVGFLNKEARRLSVIAGGIGFGLLIDEVGKFVTADNDYFFQPAFVVMYVVFILLYITVRIIMSVRPLSQREYAINAIETMKEIIYYDLDTDERDKALSYLSRSDARNPLVRSLKAVLMTLSAEDTRPDTGLITKAKRSLREVYVEKIAKGKPVLVISVVFLTILMMRFASAVVGFSTRLSFWQTGRELSLILVFLLVLPALYYQRFRYKLRAFVWFRRALVAYILLVQFFDFYFSPFSATFGLAAALLSYAVIQYLISEERSALNRGIGG